MDKIKAEGNRNHYFVQMEQMVGGKRQKVNKIYPKFVYPFTWQGYEFFAHKDGTSYSATEKISGTAIAQFRYTPGEAISDALEKLEEAGLEKFKAMLSKHKEGTNG